jgi:hypothetical protein
MDVRIETELQDCRSLIGTYVAHASSPIESTMT